MVIEGKLDRFGGIIVHTSLLENECREHFEQSLLKSLTQWKTAKRKGIWFKVDIQDSHFVPILTRHGFIFHHAQPQFVMLTKWLPKHIPSSLPLYAHTHIGVGGVVMDPEGRVLMMREKHGHGYNGWKFPGGLSDPNETIFDTAAREVREETGIEAVSETVLLFRQQATSQFPGVGDIYFVVSMSLKDPKNSEISSCPHETEEARWFTKDEIEQLPNDTIAPFVRKIIKQHHMQTQKPVMRLHTIDFSGRKMNIFMADEIDGSHI